MDEAVEVLDDGLQLRIELWRHLASMHRVHPLTEVRPRIVRPAVPPSFNCRLVLDEVREGRDSLPKRTSENLRRQQVALSHELTNAQCDRGGRRNKFTRCQL